jgi:hypothetical protein
MRDRRRDATLRRVSAVAKLVPAFLAGLGLAWGLASCGSGGAGTVAQKVKSAAATAGLTVPTQTEATTTETATAAETTTTTAPAKTVTTPAKTVTTPPQTVTTPPKTVTAPAATVTTTQTVTQGGHTAAKVAVVTPSDTTGGDGSDDDVPSWVWVLIGAGAAAAGIGGYAAWRRRRGTTDQV